ncbi:unnamed protein product [Rotaria sp. Silwood2]|nr:unnamed protein product [Rotaria sp. Silwood2]
MVFIYPLDNLGVSLGNGSKNIIAITRDGRCPQPQYVFSDLPCSTEREDDVCPWNYKCCPLIDGMKCFGPCHDFTEPCNLECPFGLKVDPSPCTICECAPDPCLSTSCPLGTKCITQEYEPCAVKGRCGLKTQCVTDPSIHVDLTPKPNNCPDYWPVMGGGLQTCSGLDALCPDKQKCCRAPFMNQFNLQDSAISYYVEPCEDISKCTLQCSHGLVIDGGCRLCRCAPNPCDRIKCAADEKCRLLPPPCVYYPGRPPCALVPACMKKH